MYLCNKYVRKMVLDYENAISCIFYCCAMVDKP